MTENAPKQQFAIQRVYLKDLSFESPLGARAFGQKQQPTMNQELNTKIEKIQDDHYEVTLAITLTSKIEDQTVFLVEIQQAGLFLISGIAEVQLPKLLNTVCPNILLPYAREAIDSTLIKGTFSPVMLSPINFEALYADAVKKRKEEQGNEQTH